MSSATIIIEWVNYGAELAENAADIVSKSAADFSACAWNAAAALAYITRTLWKMASSLSSDQAGNEPLSPPFFTIGGATSDS